MSTNQGFSHNSNNTTTQNLLILTGVAFGSVILLMAIAFLCDRFSCRWSNQDATVVAANPDQHNQSCGLDPSIIANLATFRYKKHGDDSSTGWLECVVCLSLVQEGDEVRQLPTCKHLFHQECIDMWFYSHSTCPLCRSVVEVVREEKVRGRGMTASSPVLEV
jgi:E3 ubiquitin-protein ligase ATL41